MRIRPSWIVLPGVLSCLYVGTYLATRTYSFCRGGCQGASVGFTYRTWSRPCVSSWYYHDWGPEGGPGHLFDNPGCAWLAFLAFTPLENLEMRLRGKGEFAVLFRVHVTDWSSIIRKGG